MNRFKPVSYIESRQFYEPDTAVLVTEMRGATGLVRVTDALMLRQGADLTENTAAGRRESARVIEALQGNVRLRIEVEPRGGTRAEARSGCLFIHSLDRPHLGLQFSSSVPLQSLHGVIELKAGTDVRLNISVSVKKDTGSVAYRFGG